MRSGSPMLAASGDAVVAAAGERSDGQFEHEFKQQQAELGTAPHRSIAELGQELGQRRVELAAAARSRGSRLIASATSPLDATASTTQGARYEHMNAVFGRLARTQLTCGMHVHVSVDSPAEGVGVLDRIRGWLAVLIALSANSPFLAGEDTGYASYRSLLWGQWPTAGSYELFGDVETYERAGAALVATGAALDDAMIYFDARLSARYPTVEVRVADVCAEAEDAVLIAALVRAMVATAAGEWSDGVPAAPLRSEVLRAASWRAARWGIEQDLVDVQATSTVPAWELIERFVDWVKPALWVSGDVEVVESGLARVRARGTGARRQRVAYAEAGSLAGVIDALEAYTVGTTQGARSAQR